MDDYLTFRLGGLEYGVGFGQVRDLRMLQAPAADDVRRPAHATRGLIVPLLDMRAAFGGTTRGATDVILLQLDDGITGLVVDGVCDVVRIGADHIAPLPGMPDYVLGIAEVHGRRLILVDVRRLMAIQRRQQQVA